MVKAGFNTVRIGEYSWGLCERKEGKYDFAWLSPMNRSRSQIWKLMANPMPDGRMTYTSA